MSEPSEQDASDSHGRPQSVKNTASTDFVEFCKEVKDIDESPSAKLADMANIRTSQEFCDLYGGVECVLRVIMGCCNCIQLRVPDYLQLDFQHKVVMEFFSTLENYDPSRAYLTTWVWAIAKNQRRALFRHCDKDERASHTLPVRSDPFEQPYEALAQGEINCTIAQVIDNTLSIFSLNERKVVDMKLNGAMWCDIQNATGLTIDKARRIWEHAREMLRARLRNVHFSN